MGAPADYILFGAFDRHNLGDLLFPHLLSRWLAPARCCCAGLVARDLRPQGGHRVRAIRELARAWGPRPARLIVAGGELLDCPAWEAALMLQPPACAADLIARLDGDPPARDRWAAHQLGGGDRAPYLPSPSLFQPPARLFCQALGGVTLARRDGALGAEVLAKLAQADWLSVRDEITRQWLAGQGMPATLVPDSAVLTAELCGDLLHRHGRRGAPARLRRELAQGYLALQFSADFGDDATLDVLAAQLRPLLRSRGLGLVLFRAGAAPWHDDLAVYQRLMARLPGLPVRLFRGRHLWALAALLAGARAFCGSSLHGRILATAFGVPGLTLVADPERMSKQRAYLQTWHLGSERLIPPAMVGAALAALLDERAVEPELARALAARARDGLQALRRALAA